MVCQASNVEWVGQSAEGHTGRRRCFSASAALRFRIADRRARVLTACCTALAVAITVSPRNAVVAARQDPLASLGGPTTAIPAASPLGAFARVPVKLTLHGRTELLFISALWDPISAEARWPLTKALAAFGQWAGLRSSANRPAPGVVTEPTLDWTHATYTSSYLYLVHKDVEDQHGRPLQALSPRERVIFRRYAPQRGGPYPLTLVGGYAMQGAGSIEGEMQTDTGGSLSFGTVLNALRQGYAHHYVQYVFDIDAEANVVTALICHADGGRPRSVCGQAAVRAILRHVR